MDDSLRTVIPGTSFNLTTVIMDNRCFAVVILLKNLLVINAGVVAVSRAALALCAVRVDEANNTKVCYF